MIAHTSYRYLCITHGAFTKPIGIGRISGQFVHFCRVYERKRHECLPWAQLSSGDSEYTGFTIPVLTNISPFSFRNAIRRTKQML